MKRRLSSDVPYLTDRKLEDMATELLMKVHARGMPYAFPIDVDFIAEKYLGLDFDWVDLGPDIMAQLKYDEWKIQPNEHLLDFFTRVPGALAFTKAHEILHAIAHVEQIPDEQCALDISTSEDTSVRRTVGNKAEDKISTRREYQAQRFAAYLLMPRDLLLHKVEGFNLCSYTTLKRLAIEVGVSTEALIIRLCDLNLLYKDPNGQLYRSREHATGQQMLPL